MHRSISRSTPYLPRYQSVSPARSPHLGSRRFSLPRSTSQPSQRIVYIDNAPSRVINSYHVHHSPSPSRTYRIHLCSNKTKNHLTRVTRSRSACDINSSHVYASQEDIFVRSLKESASRQVGSSEDVYHAVPFFPDVTPSESGVSFGEWEEGSTFGGEDDNVSQHSFGSSSAFCEVTVDSELDKCDSDNFSGPDYIGDRALSVLHENVSDTNYEIKRRRSRRSQDGLDSPDYKIMEPVSDTKSRRREPVSSQSLDFNKLQTQPEALSVLIPESEISGKVNADKVDSRGTPLAHSTPHVSPGGAGESKLCVMASWDVDTMGDAINGTESETSTPARTSSVQGNDSRYSSRFEDSSCNSSCSEDNYSDVSNVTASSPVTRRTKLVKRHSDKPVGSKKPFEVPALNQPDIVLARTVEGGSDKQGNNYVSEEVKQQRSGKSSNTFNGSAVLEAQQKLTTDESEQGKQANKHTAGNEWWASYDINETAGQKSKVSSQEGDAEKSLLFRRIPAEAKPPAVNIPLITAGKHGQEKLRKMSQMSPPLGSPTNGSPPVFPNDFPNFGEKEKDVAEHLTAHDTDVRHHVASPVQSDNIQHQKRSEVEWEDGNKPSVCTNLHQGLSNTSSETTENSSSVSQVENPTRGEVLQLELPSASLLSTEERVNDWQKYVNGNGRALSHATENEGAIVVKEAVEVMKTEPDNCPSHIAIMSREPNNNVANIKCSDGRSTVYGVATDETLDATCGVTSVVHEDSHQQITAQSRVEDHTESSRVTVDTPQLHVNTDVVDSVENISQFDDSTTLDICTAGSTDEFISKQNTSDDHQNAVYWEENEVGKNRANILDWAVDNTLTPNSEATEDEELGNGKFTSDYMVSSDNVDAVIFAKNSNVLDAGNSDSCSNIKDVVLSDIIPDTVIAAVAAENIVTQDLHQLSASAPTTSDVDTNIIIETAKFEQSQPHSIDTQHMGNTIDSRDTPQVVHRDVSSHLFLGIGQHSNPDLDLSIDTTPPSGNSLSASWSVDSAREVTADTAYKSQADSYILSSLEQQQLVHSLEDPACETSNTDNSTTVNESGHIEGKDSKAHEASFVQATDTQNVQGENGFNKHTEETVNFVERQECVYCPSHHEKAGIILERSSRLIESGTCITSPTVVAENKVHSSVPENSSCSDPIGVDSVADLCSIETFTTSDKKAFFSADKEVFPTTDSEAFTTADKQVFLSTDSEAFTTADKEVFPTTVSEAFTTADKQVFLSTDSEAFTSADKQVFLSTDSEAFTTADKQVFLSTDSEAFTTADKEVFLSTDSEAFTTADKQVFLSTDSEALTTADKEVFISTDSEAFTTADKEIFPSTDSEAFTTVDKEVFATTSSEAFTTVDKEVFATTSSEAFTTVDKEVFPTTSSEAFTTVDKEVFHTKSSEEFTTVDKEVFPTTSTEAFTTVDKEVFPTTSSEAFTTVDKEVFHTRDNEAFTTVDKEVYHTTSSEAFTTADKEVFPTTSSEAFTTVDKEVFPTRDRETLFSTDKKAFPSTDKEAFLTTDEEVFSSTVKEAFPITDKEAFLTQDKEAFSSTNKEAFLSTDKEAFPSTDKEAFPSTDKEAFPSTNKEAFSSTDKEDFPSTDKENFPSTDNEDFPSTDKGDFSSTDKEVFLKTDKEVFLKTDKEAFLTTDKEAFLTTDKEAILTTDKEPSPTVDKEVFATTDKDICKTIVTETIATTDKETFTNTGKDYTGVTADESYSCINKEITIRTEPISIATCVTVSSPATSRNTDPEIIYGLNHPAFTDQITNPTLLLSTSCLEAETQLTIPSSLVSSSCLTTETSVQSDHFLAPECVQKNIADAESGVDFAYHVSSPVTSVSELEVGELFDSVAHTQEATMHPNNPLEKLQAQLSLLSGDTELNVTLDRNQRQDRTEAPDAFQNSVLADTCDFIDFSKDPCKSIDEESAVVLANGVVVLRDELNNSTEVGVNSNAGSHVVTRYDDSDYDNVTSSGPVEQHLYTRPRHLHLLHYAHTKVSDLWALQEETESAMNTPSPKQPRVTFTNDADSSNLHSTYSAHIIHGNSIEQNVQDDQVKKLLNGHTRLVSNSSIVEMNDKSGTVSIIAESSIDEVKSESDVTPTLSEVKSVAMPFDGDILGNHIADDETGESENSSTNAIHRQTPETVSGVFRAHLVNISHTGVENSHVDVSVDEDKNRISHLGTFTSNLGYSTNSQTGEDLMDNVSSLDTLSASLKQFSITNVSSIASDSGYFDDSLVRTYEIEMNSDEDANKTSSYLPSYSLGVSAASTSITETPTKTNKASVYTCTGTAEIKETPLNDSQLHTPETDFRPLPKKTVANNKLTNGKIKQFEKILYEFNKGLRTSQDISDFLFFCENYADYRDSSTSSSEELYKHFTNDDSEKVQNHTCITVEDENMNTFRFKRYLKKSHAKRNNGRKILRFLSKLSCVSETMSSPFDKPSEKVKLSDRFAQIFSTDSMPNSKMRISNPVLISSTSSQLHDILNSSSKRYDNNGNTSFDSLRTSADSAYSSLSDPSLGSLSSPAFRHTPGALESVSSVFNLDIATGEWTFPDNVFSNTSDLATRTTFAKNATNQSVGHHRDTVFSSSDEIHHFNFSENEIDGALLNRMRYGHVQAELN